MRLVQAGPERRPLPGLRIDCGRDGSNEEGSSSYPRSRRDLRTSGKPVPIGAELQSELFIVDAEISVAAARHCLRHQPLHLLSHHPDIDLAAAEIAEAVIAEAIVEMAEQHDVMLQREVRTPATA